jgi:hypothetical protein
MNEQLQQAVAELIAKSISTAEKAGQFIMSEMPDVIEQVMVWSVVWSLIWFFCGVFIVILTVYGNYRLYVWANSDRGDTDDMVFMLLTILPVIAGIGLCANNFDWLKIWIAPKMWLIEYAAKLVK